jgi:nucleotide-binding universal stress UspA family protein
MKNVLVALDGSPRAPGVLASGVACAQGAGIVLVRVVGLAEDVRDLWRTTDVPALEFVEQQARAYLEACRALVPPGSLVDVEVVVGSPWEAICATARAHHSDLVVIGSHGYSTLDRLIGTTAAKVVNHAPCSVLVVRATS